MWLWWVLSLIILVICLIFAFRIFTTSQNLHRQVLEEEFGAFPSTKPSKPSKRYLFRQDPQEQAIILLKTRLQQVLTNSDRYLDQLNKLTNRLEALETGKMIPTTKKTVPDEDWEEMYYEESAKKEKLENELDLTQQTLQDVEEKMLELERKQLAYKEAMSGMEGQLGNIQTLQERIDLLERQLQGSSDREQDLKQQLDREISGLEQLRLMEKDYIRLQSESDELRLSLQELGNRNRLAEKKIHRLSELESTLDATEYEKSELRKTLEEIIMDNESLSLKLQELQDKLGTEKYA